MTYFLTYLIVAGLIVVGTLIALRGEPTAHGQIVGFQVGCILAVLWPIAIPWILLCLASIGIRKAYRRIKEKLS